MMPAALPDVPARLLVIDRERALAEVAAVRVDAFDIQHAADGRAGLAALHAGHFDVVLADLESLADIADLPEGAVTRLARIGGSALLIVVTATDSVSAAVGALQAGAHDCLMRPLSAGDLVARIAALRARHDRRGAVSPLVRAPVPGPGRLIGHAPQMQVVLDQLKRIAASSAPVFLTGESGTGKRLAAQTLHALGPHAERPFIAIDCAAATGANSGGDALSALAGATEAAALADAGGGTLYLHEISALGAAAQARLMTLVEPGASARLSLRIVCSTRRNPANLVKDKLLRHDLFYRLNVLPLCLPPLRQRPEDIAPLATHFLRMFSRASGRQMTRFTPGALAYLEAHAWPGNVRQLENLMRRIVAMFDGAAATPQMLGAADIEAQAGGNRATPAMLGIEDDILPMWMQEQRIIEAAIVRFDGNIARAAAALEISPSTIYRKKQAWEELANNRKGAA